MKSKLTLLAIIFFLVLYTLLPQGIANSEKPKQLLGIENKLDQISFFKSNIIIDSLKKLNELSRSKFEKFKKNNDIKSLIDSTVSLYGDSGKSKTIYKYNQEQKKIETIVKLWENNSWQNWERIYYTIDSNYYAQIVEYFDGTNWTPSRKYESKYNDDYNLIFDRSYRWSNEWILEFYEENEYLPSGQISSREWNFIGYSIIRYGYKYNSNDDLIEKIETELLEDLTLNKRKEEYLYNINGFSNVTITYIWENESWIPISKDFKNYQDNKTTKNLIQIWINGVWENNNRSTQNYNDNDQQILYLSEIWIENKWVNEERRQYFYKSDHYRIQFISENWSGEKWVMRSNSKTHYDSRGNLIKNERYTKNIGSNDIYISKYEAEYDSKNNIVYSANNEFTNGKTTFTIIKTLKYDSENRKIIETLDESYGDGNSSNSKIYNYYNDAELTLLRDDQKSLNKYFLTQNFPNPFNSNSTISFINPKAGVVAIRLYNILGQKIETITEKWFPKGTNYVYFNSNRVASGTYLYRLEAGGSSESKKMIILK